MTDQWYPIESYSGEYVLLTDGDNIYGGEWDEDHWNIGVAEYDPSNWSPTHWQPVTIPSNIKNQERWYDCDQCYMISSKGIVWSKIVSQTFDLKYQGELDSDLQQIIDKFRIKQHTIQVKTKR